MFKNISKSLIYIVTTLVIIAATFGVTNMTVVNAANETTIGYVDVDEVQSVYQTYITAYNNVAKEYERLQKEYESKSKSLTQSDKDKMLENYNKQISDYAVKTLEPSQTAFSNAVASAAKDKGVTIVLTKTSFLYGGVDLTATVKTKLNIK